MPSKLLVTIPKAPSARIPVFAVASLDAETLNRLCREAERLAAQWSREHSQETSFLTRSEDKDA